MYIVAEDPISGALVKLAGEVHLTETGQLITTFKNNPQLAFEDAELHFFGGERAPLVDTRALRRLHHERDVRAVVGQRSGALDLDVQHHLGPERQRRAPARACRSARR